MFQYVVKHDAVKLKIRDNFWVVAIENVVKPTLSMAYRLAAGIDPPHFKPGPLLLKILSESSPPTPYVKNGAAFRRYMGRNLSSVGVKIVYRVRFDV